MRPGGSIDRRLDRARVVVVACYRSAAEQREIRLDS
jgi:hypothetical protein